jgi:hypothetical protein
MNIHSVIGKIVPIFRRKRMAGFVDKLRPTAETTILDIGGSAFNWDLINSNSKITLLNLLPPKEMRKNHGQYDFVIGDGTALKYENNSFDIAYSNSVIEHLHSWEMQKKFALELSRVGEKLWVQTPAKWFFIEPHFITPFIHFFPKTWQRHLLRNFTIWGWITRPSQSEIDGLLEEIRLLTFSEMKQLFPDCEIERERFLFFTKCYIAIRK